MQRQPPVTGEYPEAGITLYRNGNTGGYWPQFKDVHRGITAEQAREAAHLLNQLAEYLECKQS